MRSAKKPAPKPLSMLTTLTPLAQELSIDNNALNPRNWHVPDARRHRDDRARTQPADDAGECAFHPRQRRPPRARPPDLPHVPKPLQPRHTDIRQALYTAAERFRCLGGLLGHRQVARTRAGDNDAADGLWCRACARNAQMRHRIIPKPRQILQKRRGFGGKPCD